MLDPQFLQRLIARRDFLAGATTAAAAGSLPFLPQPAAAADNPIGRFLADVAFGDPLRYPAEPQELVINEARRLSNAVLKHVSAFLDGLGPAELPPEAIPVGVDKDEHNLFVARPQQVAPEDYWVVRPAEPINLNRLRGLYPDPHCTYLIPAAFLAPFGSRVEIEGDFPHSRFFSIQVTPPFDPRNYYYNGAFGVMEVPIADVDIDPKPGHTNPFRPGADRRARERGYKVELEIREGDGALLEPAFHPPHYRARSNRRLGSGIVYQGPLGRPGQRGGHGRGMWGLGAIWIRYYAPDLGGGPLAGVSLPRLTQYLPDGRPFVILCNKAAKESRLNRTFPAPSVAPAEPDPDVQGAAEGWQRELDIFHSGIVGIWRGVGKSSAADKAKGRALVKGAAARGEDLPPPNNWGSSASRSPHIQYLVRGMALGRDRVIVLTGRLPTHPSTLAGQSRMAAAQVRYFSITTYADPDIFYLEQIGVAITSLMDEEIVVDENGWYVIAYSRTTERPRNAVAESGVTWANWGPSSKCGWTIRWLTVDPDHKDRRITPDDANISYGEASWLSPKYRRELVGINGKSPLMGDFIPRVHYLHREAFEAMGSRVQARDVPVWK